MQVTGHSLGGSLASLAASFVVGSGFAKTKNTKLVTLGQPRTGDLVYAIGHNTQVLLFPNNFYLKRT